jgi:hypothetical protein
MPDARRPRRDAFLVGAVQPAQVAQDDHRLPAHDEREGRHEALELLLGQLVAQRAWP